MQSRVSINESGSPITLQNKKTPQKSHKEKCDEELYKAVLRSELFGIAPTNNELSKGKFSTPQSLKRKLFTFKSPSNQKLGNSFEEQYKLKSSNTSLAVGTYKILESPRKCPRFISKKPYKVLDAPEINDDFFFNILDWGNSDIIAVGLSSSVFLWSNNSGKVHTLCNYEDKIDVPTSIKWHKNVF